MTDDNLIVKNIFDNINECRFDSEKRTICSPVETVEKMKEFVIKNTDNPIDIVNLDEVKILGKIKDLLNCNSESCVVKHPKFKNFAKILNSKEFLDKFFKPQGPSLNFNLLSNINIDGVLDQLAIKYPDFLHIPFQMKDFERVGTELATIDLARKFKGDKLLYNKHVTEHPNIPEEKRPGRPINKFGVVLNTDVSSGGGIHWYCIYGEIVDNEIILEYFNSSGYPPLKETQAWLCKTMHYLNMEINKYDEMTDLIKFDNIKCKIEYSTGIYFQKDEHSCGVYCLMYIWLRLEGVNRSWFTKETFGDSLMHDARKVLFRHEL